MAEYWDQDSQVHRLQSAFAKWDKKGAWNASALNVCRLPFVYIFYKLTRTFKVHLEQMKHVTRGCLTRTRQDIPSDGSRIEGSHKGWNSLQRSFASGLEVMTALGSDFVLRRNIRIGSKKSSTATPFLQSTFGSHHTRLTNAVAKQYNELVTANTRLNGHLEALPELPMVSSGEQFGIVKSEHASTFAGLFVIKNESDDEDGTLPLASIVEVGPEALGDLIPMQAKNEEQIVRTKVILILLVIDLIMDTRMLMPWTRQMQNLSRNIRLQPLAAIL